MVLSALFMALTGSSLAALPNPERLAALLDHPEAKRYVATRVSLPDGSTWIQSEADIEGVFLGSIEDVIAVLKDYEAGSKVFSRVESVKVRSRGPDYAITEQKNAIKILGLSYEATIIFQTRLYRLSSRTAESHFVMVDSDGSTRSVEGGWRLEAVEVGGRSAYYVENYCTMLVAPRFPLQLQIMKSFGKSDYERTMRELGAAVAARSAVAARR